MPYGRFLELALYDPDHGFYRAGGKAGRRGDFITSPEVGPLFGQVVANALDAEWTRLGQPEEFTVVDAGAGPGTLARAVHAATAECADALQYVAVESSPAQRSLHPDTVTSTGQLPDHITGVVIANELLDNLAFEPIRRGTNGWEVATVTNGPTGLILGWQAAPGDLPFDETVQAAVHQPAARAWLADVLARIDRGRLLVIDYCRMHSAEVEVRTYAQHGRGGDPLEQVGLKDITVDVDLEQLQQVQPASSIRTQADWLRHHGIDDLVEEGRRVWEASAAVGDLAALRMRSRVREAEALTDATGLGGFTVAEWVIS